MRRVVAWIVIFALAMAFVESAVVVYLRVLADGGPFADPGAALLLPRVLRIEVAREAATIIMLVALARLAGRTRWEQALLFSIAFAVWDIGYYGWLWVLIGWPPSLLTWDVLFLIPVPWTAPVLAPVLVSLGLIAGAAWWLTVLARGQRPAFRPWNLGAIVLGGVIILSSFTLDYRAALLGRAPARYHWELFAIGFVLGGVGTLLAARRGETRADPG